MEASAEPLDIGTRFLVAKLRYINFNAVPNTDDIDDNDDKKDKFTFVLPTSKHDMSMAEIVRYLTNQLNAHFGIHLSTDTAGSKLSSAKTAGSKLSSFADDMTFALQDSGFARSVTVE